MTVTKINELRQKGAALVAQARGIQENPKGENGKLTPEQRDKIQSILAECDEIREQIRTEERLAGIASAVEPPAADGRLPERRDDEGDEPEEEREARSLSRTPEYRRAFERYIRGGEDALTREDEGLLREVRAMSEGVDAEGGYLAPEDLVVAVEREAADIEQLAPRMTVINTSARAVEFNREAEAISFGWVAELQQKPEDQPALGRVRVDVHTGAGTVFVSDELLEDAQFDLISYLGTLAAEAKVELEEAAFLSGDGAGKPYGILYRINNEPNTPQRYTTQSADAIHGDDFLRSLYALPRRYRRNAAFVVGTQALLAARLLKDANDNYIWQPGLQAGEPDRIVGKPVIESPDLALDNPIAGGNDVAIVGDLRRYRVLRRAQLQVKRLEEIRALTDEVGLRFRFRTGGDVQFLDAFRSIRIQAAV